MKPVLIFLTLLAVSLSCPAQSVLKQKTEKLYNSSWKLTGKIVHDYDKTGYLIKRSWVDQNNLITGYTQYTNDAKGRSIIDTSFNQSATPTETYLYEYDQYNEIIRQTRTYPERGDLYMEIYENTYDANGNMIKQKQFDKDSILDWVYIYEFNAENQMVRFFSRFNDTLKNERTYTYKKGLKVAEILYDYENEELKRTKNELYFYEYDSTNRIIKRTVHAVPQHLPKKIIYTEKFSYNKEGNLILKERFEDGLLESYIVYTYAYW